jgi:glucosamine--fructose-6-phosphate aminotransferase (isomerizing)
MVLRSNIHDQIKGIAKNLVDRKVEHMFVLGKGAAMPIALEGALKIKEISYIHAEGYPGGALKHGPFALIEEGTYCSSPSLRFTFLSALRHADRLRDS